MDNDTVGNDGQKTRVSKTMVVKIMVLMEIWADTARKRGVGINSGYLPPFKQVSIAHGVRHCTKCE